MRSATYFIVGLILLAMALKMGTDKQFIKAMVLISVTVASIETVWWNLLVYSILTPYPATDTFKLCKKYELIDDDYGTEKQIEYYGN